MHQQKEEKEVTEKREGQGKYPIHFYKSVTILGYYNNEFPSNK